MLCFTRPRYQVSVYRTNGPLVIILIPTPDFPHFYYMLGGNLGSLLYGDVSVMDSLKDQSIIMIPFLFAASWKNKASVRKAKK